MARPKRTEQLNEVNGPLDVSAIVDLGQVREARRSIPGALTTLKMAELFSSMADPTRLRIIAILEDRQLCVGDIAGALGLSDSAASHQLRVLRDQGLVRASKHGRLVYYTLDDEHVQMLFRQAYDHVSHRESDA